MLSLNHTNSTGNHKYEATKSVRINKVKIKTPKNILKKLLF